MIICFFRKKSFKNSRYAKDTKILPINSAAVIGWYYGRWNCNEFANVGIPVIVIEDSQESLDNGIKIIEKNYSNTVSKGRMSDSEFKVECH